MREQVPAKKALNIYIFFFKFNNLLVTAKNIGRMRGMFFVI